MKHYHNDCRIIDRVYTILFILLLTLSAESFITAKALADYANNMVISTQLIIEENASDEISNTKITIGDTLPSQMTAIVVKKGASLTLKDSLFDLSNIREQIAIIVEEGATLTIDHTEISGANGMPRRIPGYFSASGTSCYFFINGGTLRIINGSVIQNNFNNNLEHYGFDFFESNIFSVINGNLVFKDSSYQKNGIRKDGIVGYCSSSIVHFLINNSDVDIENSKFHNNYCFQLILAEKKGHIRISNTIFEDNSFCESHYRYYSGVVSTTDVILNLENSNIFRNNVNGNALEISNTELHAHGNSIFLNNKTGINALYSVVDVSNAQFIENKTQGIRLRWKSVLTVTDCNFEKNNNGAIHYSYYDNEYSDGIVGRSWHHITYFDKPKFDPLIRISKSSFKNNTEGAVYIGDINYKEKLVFTKIPVEIENSIFTENILTNTNDIFNKKDDERFFGAGIYIGDCAYAHLHNLVVTGNSASEEGSGIAVGQKGQLILHPRFGASVFSNTSQKAADEYQDIYFVDITANNKISNKMLNGKSHKWEKGTPIINAVKDYKLFIEYQENLSEICGDDKDCYLYYENWCEEYPNYAICEDGWVKYYGWEEYQKSTEGIALKSHPQSTEIPEGNIVLVKGNSAAAAEGKSAYGGGIAVNGILEVGEPGVTVSVRKVWNVEGDAIPTPEEFLPMLKLTANGQSSPTGEIRQLSQTDEDGKTVTVFSIENDPWVTIRVTDAGDKVYEVLYEDLPAEIGGEAVIYSVTEESSKYEIEQSGDMEQGFEIVNTLKEEEEQTWFRFIENGGMLPRTGFSALNPQELPQQGAEISYKASGLTLQIPSLSVTAEIVTVPAVDEDYPVEWLGGNAGLLEGSSEPGKGVSIIAAHNHLNTTEAGPFALLSELEAGDVLFVLDRGSQYRSFRVYASEKIGENDTAALRALAEEAEDPLLLITCEDERPEGGYANRRIVAASPM